MLISFSLLPLELIEKISFYLLYRDIISFCRVEKVLIDIPNNTSFWRNLIRKRFPEVLCHTRMMMLPRWYFRDLEHETCHITLASPDKKSLYFVTHEETIIAVTILICSKIFSSREETSIVDELSITRDNGKVLTNSEAYRLLTFSRRDLLLGTKVTFYLKSKGKMVILVPRAFFYITEHVLKLLQYIGAENIEIGNRKATRL